VRKPSGLVEALVDALVEAPSVAVACSVVVEHLLLAGLEMPSLYLARGDRLRCQAVRGYWQVFDGMPVDAGVIGATYRSGRPIEVRGVGGSGDYLAAVAGVVDEVCVPIVAAGRVVGALNVESVSGLPPDALAVTCAAAAVFGDRLAALGGVPAESAAQRLARHAVIIAEARDRDRLWVAAGVAAREVTGFSSVVVALRGSDSRYHLAHAAGPIAQRLVGATAGGWPTRALETIAGWVASGSSCWTLNDPGGAPMLRAAGAAAVLVVGLAETGPGSADAGFLLVADAQPAQPATDVVELLELLGTHVSSCARNLASLAALRRQASRDPLTDLGHHAAYHAALAAALVHPPAGRQVAVVMVDIDDFKSVNDRAGHPAGDALLRNAARVLSAVLRDGEELYRVGGDEFAAILHVADPIEARSVAERLHGAAHDGLAATISVGVAMAAAGEPPAAVIARADNALYQVKRAGRDGVKLATTVAARKAG